ncbi:MAG: dihydrofolate reductase family protein [Eubacteriales bacterium]
MRKVILYVATSLDGYLAEEQGGLDWLHGENPEEISPWYEEFYHSIDTILMGKKTYEQIAQELSPEFWIYGDKESYVFTHENQDNLDHIQFTDKKPSELLRYLKNRKGKDIWLCGGADLIAQMMEEDLIDVVHLSLIPTLLGKGIPLFPKNEGEKRLSLESVKNDNGIVDLVYVKK